MGVPEPSQGFGNARDGVVGSVHCVVRDRRGLEEPLLVQGVAYSACVRAPALDEQPQAAEGVMAQLCGGGKDQNSNIEQICVGRQLNGHRPRTCTLATR